MTTTDRSKSIKSTIARLGTQATPKQIVEALADLGIDVSENQVPDAPQRVQGGEASGETTRKGPAKEKTAAEKDTGAAGVAGRLLKQNFCFP